MIIKLKLENLNQNWVYPNSPFQEGVSYIFTHKTLTHSTNGEFIGRSRLDGDVIFEFTTAFKYPIVGFTILGMGIESVSFIGATSDSLAWHITKYKTYGDNKEKLSKYFFEMFGITKEDLYDDDLFKAKLRDIKIDLIL